jgi:hypothetical protein
MRLNISVDISYMDVKIEEYLIQVVLVSYCFCSYPTYWRLSYLYITCRIASSIDVIDVWLILDVMIDE